MSREFFFKRKDARKVVLLLHGLTGSPSELVYLGRALFKAGFDVHAPILPGHAAGIEGIKSKTWQDWYRFSLSSFDELQAEYDEVFVAGLCLGATLALAVAEARPQVRGISALAPLLRLDGWSIPWTHRLMPLALYTPLKFYFLVMETGSCGVKNEKAREMMQAAFALGDDALDCFPMMCVLELFRFSRFIRRHLKGVRAPLALFHSEEDDFAHIRTAELIYSKVGSAQKSFRRLTNSYHLIAIDNEKDVVAQETISFFNALPPRPA